MHASVRAVIVAAGLATAIAASAFAVQAIGLPRPQRGSLLGAEAVGAFDRWQLADFRGRLNGVPVSGTCFQGFFHAPGEENMRGTAVLADGDRIIAADGSVRQFGETRVRRVFALSELRLACPQGDVFARRLAQRALTVKQTHLDGLRADAFRFKVGAAWLTYVVDAHTHVPVWIAIKGRRLSGAVDIAVRDNRTQLRRVIGTLRRGGELHDYAYPA